MDMINAEEGKNAEAVKELLHKQMLTGNQIMGAAHDLSVGLRAEVEVCTGVLAHEQRLPRARCSMQSLREREGARLVGMRRRWAEEKEGVERQLKAQLSAKDKEEEERRDAWEVRARGKTGKELEARVEEAREKARQERDAEIEVSIRRIQASTAKAGSDYKEHLENRKGRMRSASEGVVQNVKGKKERWGKRMGENVDLIRNLEESKWGSEANRQPMPPSIVPSIITVMGSTCRKFPIRGQTSI